MTVTTSYSLTNVEALAPEDGFGGSDIIDMDLTSTATGGFAISGFHSGEGHVDFNLFNDKEVFATSAGMSLGSHSAIDQLANGNFVIATDDGSAVHYALVSSAGSTITDFTSLGNSGTTNADVAALAGGGFVVVHQDNFGGTDNDVQWYLRNADGSAVTSGSMSLSSDNDRNATVCALGDGGFAVAWEREVAAETEVWYAVFNADGTTRKTAAMLDSTGAVNRNASIAATADGGFAIAYEDSGWTGGAQVDITVATFDAAGVFASWVNATSATSLNASSASLIGTKGGMLALTYDAEFGVGDHDVYLQLLNDGASAPTLAGSLMAIASTGLNETDASLAEYGTGQIAIGFTNTGASDGQTQTILRTSVGDAAADTINGDDFLDSMTGGAGNDLLKGFGNNDTLNGGDNNDTLNGGKGGDLITGGLGKDILTGQGGKDIFDFDAIGESTNADPDRITDLSNKDRIDLKDIDADTGAAGDQKFHLVTEFNFEAREALLTYHDTGVYAGKTTLELDDDGDGVADFTLLLDGNWEGFTKFAL